MVWNEINTEQNLNDFLELYDNFHDSCLKELRYISGNFVDCKLGMHIAGQTKLSVIFQRQHDECTVVEMEFSNLLKLNLQPLGEPYTNEILDASMFFKDGKIYWGDSYQFKEQLEQYDGTWLCAEKARWRCANECIGEKQIYITERRD